MQQANIAALSIAWKKKNCGRRSLKVDEDYIERE